MSIFVPSYWPFYATKEKRRFDYFLEGDPAPQFASTFSYDARTDSMLYVDTDAAGKLVDTWFYQHRDGIGVAEWRDDYPGGVSKVFSTPIGWGQWQGIGTTYENKPVVNPLKTWPPTKWFPPTGKQVVTFEALHDRFKLRDGTEYMQVLVFLYQQTFGGKTGGARYYMAQGIGPVALEFVAPNPDGTLAVTGRHDARLTRLGV